LAAMPLTMALRSDSVNSGIDSIADTIHITKNSTTYSTPPPAATLCSAVPRSLLVYLLYILLMTL